MNDPYRPPIASPDGTVAPMPVAPLPAGDWKSAPKIVRSWAYQLTWLGIVILPLVILASLFSAAPGAGTNPGAGAERVGMAIFYVVLLGVDIWLNRALKKGSRAAWTVQIILSCLGLFAFPVGTAIHIYILTQWFKPETRAWFGQN